MHREEGTIPSNGLKDCFVRFLSKNGKYTNKHSDHSQAAREFEDQEFGKVNRIQAILNV